MGKRKLNDADVAAIRLRYARGERPSSIASDFGVSGKHVNQIARGVSRPDGSSALEPQPHRRGNEIHTAKLTPALVRAIRIEAARGMSYAEMGRMLKLTPNTVRLATIGQTWRWVTP